MINYTQSNVSNRPQFYSEKYGNLLSDTYQASIDQSSNGTWNAWVYNFSRHEHVCFKLNLKSKRSAIRFANKVLRGLGIND